MSRKPLVPSNDKIPLWEGTREAQGQGGPPRWLSWWYSLSAPAEPGQDASLAQRDLFRRGRLASVILLMMVFTVAAFIPLALFSFNTHTLPIVLSLLVVCCIALFVNRLGYVTAVGIFVVASIDAALILTIVTAPILALNINSLPVFDLFILSELAAVSILPAAAVFVVALLNCSYIVASLLLMPHSADLGHLMANSLYSVLIRPVALRVIVALVTYLWVRNAQDAIARADHAEVVARLEHTIAQQKLDLDYGVQQLLRTLVQAANGDMSVRTPLAKEHVLWQVAVSLNTLLARLQRSSQSEYELQRLRAEIAWLAGAMRDAKNRRLPLPPASGSALIDPINRELSGHYLVLPRQGKEGPPTMI